MGKPHVFISSVVFEPGTFDETIQVPRGTLIAQTERSRTYQFNSRRRQLVGEAYMFHACRRGFIRVIAEAETTAAGLPVWPMAKKNLPRRPLGPAVFPPAM